VATRNLPTSTRNQKELNYVCVCVDEPRRRQSVLAIQIQEDAASLSGLQFRRACGSLAEAAGLEFDQTVVKRPSGFPGNEPFCFVWRFPMVLWFSMVLSGTLPTFVGPGRARTLMRRSRTRTAMATGRSASPSSSRLRGGLTSCGRRCRFHTPVCMPCVVLHTK
jgi:hypothetical protein